MRRLIMLVVSASLLAGLAVVVPSVVTPAKAPQAEARVFIDAQQWAHEQAIQSAYQRQFGPYDIDANRACRVSGSSSM